MNKYNNPFFYGGFRIGMNFWYVLAPAFIVLMAIYGWRTYYGYYHIHKRKRKTSEKFLSIIGTIGMFILVAVESGRGIVQFLDNHYPGDSALATPFMIVLFAPFLVYGYYRLCRFAAKFFTEMHKQEIEERQKRRRRLNRWD